ncbi:MAG TPA: SRPBCC family protein [Actinomycetota bacterium]
MAEQTEGTITIDASPAAVMGAIADFEAYPEWAQGVKKTEILETDGEGRGKRVRFEVSAVGLSGWYVLSYDYEPGDQGVSWTFEDGSPIKNLEGSYGLTPDGDATDVVYRAVVDPGVPMIGFMKRKVEKMVIDTALKGLKKRVESL